MEAGRWNITGDDVEGSSDKQGPSKLWKLLIRDNNISYEFPRTKKKKINVSFLTFGLHLDGFILRLSTSWKLRGTTLDRVILRTLRTSRTLCWVKKFPLQNLMKMLPNII